MLLAVAAPAGADDPESGYIRGYVRNESGRPAYGVCVSTGEYATDVQPDGTYELQASYETSYHVYFYDCHEAADYPYVSPWFWGGDDTYWSGDTIALGPGKVAYANVTLPSAPGSPPEFGAVAGLIKSDVDGDYLEERVYLISETGALYRGFTDMIGHVEGREAGRFIVSAPPGEYRLLTLARDDTDAYLPVYYGDHPRGFAVLFEEADRIQIQSGRVETGFDIMLTNGESRNGESGPGGHDDVDIGASSEHPGIKIEATGQHFLDRVALYEPDSGADALNDFHMMAFPGVPTIVPARVDVLVPEEMLGPYDVDTLPVWLNHTKLEPCQTESDDECITNRSRSYRYVGMVAIIEVRTATGGIFRVGDRPQFYDSEGSPFTGDILWLAESGVTKGCNAVGDLFCPDDAVTRGQMAAFLSRALGLTARLDDPFSDDDGSIFEGDIERLAAAEITRGCNPPTNDRFCPDDSVTRGQMAAFLVRALGYAAGAGSDRFTDDDGSIFEADIERLAEAGVTLGCNPPANDRFCPGALVTRAQMAAFLHRALGT